jgi:hypothetical protein
MPIAIKDHEIELLIAEIKAATGMNTTQILRHLLRQEALKLRKLRDVEKRRKRIKVLSQRYCKRLKDQRMTIDEVVGYDETGLPSG